MSKAHSTSPRLLSRICAKCKHVGYRFRGDRWLCIIHHRMDCMKTCARKTGKTIPSDLQLESLISELIRKGMTCIGCDMPMAWAGERGQRNVVTLQHDRDGTIRLICKSCNCRHAAFPGDTFYLHPPGHRYCPKCNKVFPPDRFYRGSKFHSYCKDCLHLTAIAAWAKNKEKQ